MEEKIIKTKNQKLKIAIKVIVIIMVVLCATNSYATTIGYKNIFFAVNNNFKPVDVIANGKAEILSNKDITISYQAIKVADKINVQVNRLIVEDNNAELQISVEYDSQDPKLMAKYCIVHDITGDVPNKLIGNEELNTSSRVYTQNIKLVGMRENTKKLEVELQDEEYATISVFEVDLENKQINIVMKKQETSEFEKIAETELKDVLSDFARINFYRDLDAFSFYSEKEYRNEQLVLIALDYLKANSSNKDTVHNVIKEFTGKEIKNYLEISNIIATYDRQNNKYKYITEGFTGRKALCLSIEDISYTNGIYTVKFIYCYPTKEDYANNIENIDEYFGEIKLSINKDYKYSKYRIENLDSFTSYKLDKNKIEANTNTIDVSNTTVANNVIVANNIVKNNVVNNTAVTNNVVKNNTVTNNTVNNVVTANVITTNTVSNNTTNNNVVIADKERDWKNIWIPGLKTSIPQNWVVEVYDDCYDGQQDEGKISATVTGNVNGDTVIVDFLMPSFVNDCYNTDEYCNKVSREYGTRYEGAGYLDEYNNMNWGVFGFEYIPQSYQVSRYCHFERTSDFDGGIGYSVIVDIESPNITLETFEILDHMFTNMKTTSF